MGGQKETATSNNSKEWYRIDFFHNNTKAYLKGHGNEPDFPRFLLKSVMHRSLTLHFEPFRFWIWILADICIQKTTPWLKDMGSRWLSVSTIRGVGDSPTQRYGESTALRITDTRSQWLPPSQIRRVGYNFLKENSLYRWNGESSTPRIVASESRRLRVSLIRRVTDSPYPWVGE
jgi:hypothetical protein